MCWTPGQLSCGYLLFFVIAFVCEGTDRSVIASLTIGPRQSCLQFDSNPSKLVWGPSPGTAYLFSEYSKVKRLIGPYGHHYNLGHGFLEGKWEVTKNEHNICFWDSTCYLTFTTVLGFPCGFLSCTNQPIIDQKFLSQILMLRFCCQIFVRLWHALSLSLKHTNSLFFLSLTPLSLSLSLSLTLTLVRSLVRMSVNLLSKMAPWLFFSAQTIHLQGFLFHYNKNFGSFDRFMTWNSLT